jgi:hypothetical protein
MVRDQRPCAIATINQSIDGRRVSCYAVYDDVGNNLSICNLSNPIFIKTEELMINQINVVWHVSLWTAHSLLIPRHQVIPQAHMKTSASQRDATTGDEFTQAVEEQRVMTRWSNGYFLISYFHSDV